MYWFGLNIAISHLFQTLVTFKSLSRSEYKPSGFGSIRIQQLSNSGMDIKRQPLHFQQSSQNVQNSLKHRWEHSLQTWCPSAASPSWILVLTSRPPHEELQNPNFTKCRTSVIPNLCGLVALHISVVWETQRKWPRPSNSQCIELSTWAWSNSLLSKISVSCWPELLQCSFLILRTENLNIWREKMELNWLAHKEVHSPMEAFGAEEFLFLFKLSLFQGEVLKLQITLQTL